MTQATQKLPEHFTSNRHDADMYTALWAAAPFPRLPEDAPVEFRRLTIDIDEPQRVYAIHKATRRHQFQVLVEKYF